MTSNAADQVTGVTEASDAATVYPSTATQTASYNNLNQISILSGQSFTYDAAGNLTSDGTRTYDWDAENRLIAIGYPGQPGKATAFTYDGLGRRVVIASTPAGGGSAVTTSYIWCGAGPCQARDATNTPIREYLAEGEYLPGTTPVSLYYGIDQIGSVRRVFSSSGSAPVYAYDPYGNPLQVTLPLTDAGYAGMLTNADSGLSLTQYRAYDPVAGRWLSRDPLGEQSNEQLNLYSYVNEDPINEIDPLGLICEPQKASPKPPKIFTPPTNAPRYPPPPDTLPPGWRVRSMPPNDFYPNGYWKLEKPLPNGSWQPIDPSTMKPGNRSQTHVEFPDPTPQQDFPSPPSGAPVLPVTILGIGLYFLGILAPAPAY